MNPTNVHPDSSFKLQKEDSMPGVVLCTLILGVLNIPHYNLPTHLIDTATKSIVVGLRYKPRELSYSS